MTTQELLEAVMALETEIEATPPEAPELAAIVARIGELRGELDRLRSTLGALVPDSSSPKTADEESARYLDDALRSLLEAANSKR